MGLAAVVDVVYGYTSEHFPYQYLYNRLGYAKNSVMGQFGGDYFGSGTDFHRQFTRDFFDTVNRHWLSVYHADGFRYDCVPNYWGGATGIGYARLVYDTHQFVAGQVADPAAAATWQRFAGDRLIQCAEQLEDPVGVLYQA